VTLLLTCVADRFAAQASDRRLTMLNGAVAEDKANKATMLCRQATFAYTGLAQCSVAERTDELLMRCLSRPQVNFDQLLGGLAKEAARGIRGLPLAVRPSLRRAVRRTSFVGVGFVGIRNPANFGRAQSPDEMHPFLAVVSNAQDLTEQWRPEADQNFTVHMRYLRDGEPFVLHAAGQPFTGLVRVKLEREIHKCLSRIQHPESLARLMARAVRAVHESNPLVGPNVMCTMVSRANIASHTNRFVGGLMPLTAQRKVDEADYFKWAVNGPDAGYGQWIYSPGDPQALLHYGPNYSCNGLRLTGMRFGPDPMPLSQS
jgi:hypothetical protein